MRWVTQLKNLSENCVKTLSEISNLIMNYPKRFFIFFLAIQGNARADAGTQCIAPNGTYLKTCTVLGFPVRPTSDNSPLCKFEVRCQATNGMTIPTVFYSNAALSRHLTFKNCDGRLLIDNDKNEICVDGKLYARDLKYDVTYGSVLK